MRLKGGPELLALLDLVPKRIGNNAVRGGARAGAVVIRNDAKSRVRRKSGQTAKSLKVSSRIDGQVVSAKVSMKGKHSFLGPFLEFGVRPHWITVPGAEIDAAMSNRRPSKRQPSKKTKMRYLNNQVREGSLVINGKFVGPYVFHPGHAAFPFMRPALDTKATEAINTMGEYIKSRLSWGTLQAPAVTVQEDEA